LFGTVDSFLLWHLTNGIVHATDASNAARTMVFNIHDQKWDDDLCDMMGIPQSILPQVRDNLSHFGTCDLFGEGLPILAMAGDQQAATFGQACFEKGMVKSTYGTGCFALMNTGDECVTSKNKLLSTIAWRIDNKVTYALEGSIFVAGAAIQFLRDQFGFFDNAENTQKIANTVDNTDGVIFVPCLTGLGAPYWDANARGAIFGMSRGTQKAHIVRACLDAQAYQTRDLIDAMSKDMGQDISLIRVDGGLSNNDYVCQVIADQTKSIIDRPQNTEATVWGVAAMAFLQSGVFTTLNDVVTKHKIDQEFKPNNNRPCGYERWKKAINALQTLNG
jgi:glycerol kinase